MKIDEFNAALYYAVREDFNSVIDRRHDALIRRAIAYVEEHGFPDTPYATKCAVEALARAAARRDKKYELCPYFRS